MIGAILHRSQFVEMNSSIIVSYTAGRETRTILMSEYRSLEQLNVLISVSSSQNTYSQENILWHYHTIIINVREEMKDAPIVYDTDYRRADAIVIPFSESRLHKIRDVKIV